MIKAVNGKIFNVDNPAGKAAYTIAAIQFRKAQLRKKKQRDIDSLVINSVAKCTRKKIGQF